MITIKSTLGEGTSFEVYFPTADGSELFDSPLPVVEISSGRGSETILLVEDDERVRLLTRTILRKYGYNVLEAQSCGDALLLCEQYTEHIDLLLTDGIMPRMNGDELAKRLLTMLPSLKVLYMSGHTDNASCARHSRFHPGARAETAHAQALALKCVETLDAPVWFVRCVAGPLGSRVTAPALGFLLRLALGSGSCR